MMAGEAVQLDAPGAGGALAREIAHDDGLALAHLHPVAALRLSGGDHLLELGGQVLAGGAGLVDQALEQAERCRLVPVMHPRWSHAAPDLAQNGPRRQVVR
jgi:hypothetical protein